MHDAYKIQLLDDGSVVSAALHELGKGMPDSPDLSIRWQYCLRILSMSSPECLLQHLNPRRP